MSGSSLPAATNSGSGSECVRRPSPGHERGRPGRVRTRIRSPAGAPQANPRRHPRDRLQGRLRSSADAGRRGTCRRRRGHAVPLLSVQGASPGVRAWDASSNASTPRPTAPHSTGGTPYQRLNMMVGKLNRSMQRNPLLTEAMTRAFVFADASAAGEVDHVGKLMDSMFARAMSDGEPTEDQFHIAQGDLRRVALQPAGVANSPCLGDRRQQASGPRGPAAHR